MRPIGRGSVAFSAWALRGASVDQLRRIGILRLIQENRGRAIGPGEFMALSSENRILYDQMWRIYQKRRTPEQIQKAISKTLLDYKGPLGNLSAQINGLENQIDAEKLKRQTVAANEFTNLIE